MQTAEYAPFERILADAFQANGWRVRRQSPAGDMPENLFARSGANRYVIGIRTASEGRADRLTPLAAQTILEARTLARLSPERAAPLAVVAAQRVPPAVADKLREFARLHAPDVAMGVIDSEGLRSFSGPGLEGLNAERPRLAVRVSGLPTRLPDLFSDLNQWMLKILLGRELPDSLIGIPRVGIRNASQLAAAAKVSVMSATRLMNQLKKREFLDDSGDSPRLARVDELLEQWAAANRDAAQEIPVRWILKGGERQLAGSLRRYAANPAPGQPRCCLGLFAAADALGHGFVSGVPPHIYFDRFAPEALDRLGLTVGEAGRPADAVVRIPQGGASVFRAAVMRDGIPVSDIVQVWLDVATHPARGAAQAREIRRRALGPVLTPAR